MSAGRRIRSSCQTASPAKTSSRCTSRFSGTLKTRWTQMIWSGDAAQRWRPRAKGPSFFSTRLYSGFDTASGVFGNRSALSFSLPLTVPVLLAPSTSRLYLNPTHVAWYVHVYGVVCIFFVAQSLVMHRRISTSTFRARLASDISLCLRS